MIPNVMFRLEMPEVLADDRRVIAMHTTGVRAGLRTQLDNHHKRRIPNHFVATNRSKYRHMARQPSTKAIKMRRYGSRTDLVASGRTKRYMLSQYRISVSGNASQGFVGTLRMRFPFPASFDNSTNRVNLRQMAKEIATITSDEANDIAAAFKKDYVAYANERIRRSPKIRLALGK